MNINVIAQLDDWFLSNCDGDWEHTYGVKIETASNPGWVVTIDLTDTELEGVEFANVAIRRDDQDWLFCKVENNVFTGTGGPHSLNELLERFLAWQAAV